MVPWELYVETILKRNAVKFFKSRIQSEIRKNEQTKEILGAKLYLKTIYQTKFSKNNFKCYKLMHTIHFWSFDGLIWTRITLVFFQILM